MASSSSLESQAAVNANQPEQTEINTIGQESVNANQPERTTVTCMDCKSYNAAAKGKIEVFDHKSLDLLLTPNKNTVLHIYITALDSKSKSTSLNAGSESTTNFVEKILKKCPSLLWQANAKCETPLHIAARYGHDGIVEVLIEYCAQTRAARAQTRHDEDLEEGIEPVKEGIEPVKELLRMTNKEKDTALHEAVRYNHLEVVKLLISKDPDFSYSANDAGETPLYIAAERGFKDVLFEILDKCKSPMHGGPLGRTALHAAIIWSCKGMVERILKKIDGISRKVDNNNWNPLHLAAYFNRKDSKDISKQLLDKDKEVAYMKDTNGRTPLHIAAQHGNVQVMEVIVSKCPDCCELVDNNGWNVLHFAIKGERPRCLERIMKIIKENWSLSNLLNEKNNDGDTPLHFYSNCLASAKNFLHDSRVDKMAFNKKNQNTYDIAVTNTKLPSRKIYEIALAMNQGAKNLWRRPSKRVITYTSDTKKLEEKDKNKEGEDEGSPFKKAAEAHLVVAALITTVTFAACITMPGGFVSGGESSHPGAALLRKNAAFKAFVILDTISLVLSSYAVVIHLLIPLLFVKGYSEMDREDIVLHAFGFILGAMVAMVLAFVTGTYAVLGPSLNLAIVNCILGLTFFAIFPHVLRKVIGFSLIQFLIFFKSFFE